MGDFCLKNQNRDFANISMTKGAITAAVLIALSPVGASAEEADIGGFVENATYFRDGVGISKFRNTVQLEGSKNLETNGFFDEVSVHGTFRGTYDGVYDLNEDEFGEDSGGSITLEQIGALAGALGPGVPEIPAADVPHGGGVVLPGGDFDNAANPNSGLRVLGSHLHPTDGGVAFGVPVAPCDKDSRGCLDDYLDFDSDELRAPEFNDRLDFIREAYVDATKYLDNGDAFNVRFGRQQVVWGRTDLFRVLDVINPVDYSRNNIYDELEDIRYPMWMATAEYRTGATKHFEDLNFQLVWNFDEFRPHNLGQSGTPNQILDAGSFFRGMKNCWDNGCTVANFAAGGVATDFAPGVIGIRDVHLPNNSPKNHQVGAKVEGSYKGVGFSLNALHYRSQLPSLRGGIPADNPFTPEVESQVYDHLIAFDMHFPEVNLIGGSLDFYSDKLKSVFRLEAAYTEGEEFANTLEARLFSESDVARWVLGWDRNTFIPFLNKKRAFLLSAQVFGQHLLDHELEKGALGPVGMPDWENNYIGTLLIKGWYKNDRLSPQIIFAHDYKAEATTIAPSVDWLINDRWRLMVGANIKTGEGARKFDDCRACNPFGPFTATPAHADPLVSGSVGLGGYEPLGRFRAGPIGMAQEEDEIQITLRYRF